MKGTEDRSGVGAPMVAFGDFGQVVRLRSILEEASNGLPNALCNVPVFFCRSSDHANALFPDESPGHGKVGAHDGNAGV